MPAHRTRRFAAILVAGLIGAACGSAAVSEMSTNGASGAPEWIPGDGGAATTVPEAIARTAVVPDTTTQAPLPLPDPDQPASVGAAAIDGHMAAQPATTSTSTAAPTTTTTTAPPTTATAAPTTTTTAAPTTTTAAPTTTTTTTAAPTTTTTTAAPAASGDQLLWFWAPW